MDNKPISVLISKGKHGDSYYKYETKEQKFKAALAIFDDNRRYYDWPEEDKKKAELIDKTRSGANALNFIWNRAYAGHEYEELQTIEVE